MGLGIQDLRFGVYELDLGLGGLGNKWHDPRLMENKKVKSMEHEIETLDPLDPLSGVLGEQGVHIRFR